MKNVIKMTLMVLTLSVMSFGTAHSNTSGQTLRGAIQSAVSNGNVNYCVDNGVITLFGWVDNTVTRQKVARTALSFDEVTSVIDLITVSS